VVLHHGKVVLGSVPTLAELNLHGPEVNFAFRIEKIAGALNLPFMLSEPASKRLGLPVRHVHTCAVDGFSSEFRFYTLA
jgi:class 3 adenylate cyclase